MVGPAAKREAVAHLHNVLQMSERRACTLVAADRKMIRYRSRRPPDVELRARLRDLANQRRRFGYRRLFILLREQGEPSGINRIYRLYREEGLTVRKRKVRRRAEPSAHAHRSWSRLGSTRAGRSTLSMISSPLAAAFASSTSWMT
jgi:transposase InsO family protein